MTFLIDAGGDAGASLPDIVAGARAAESLGADGLLLPETKHDAFVQLTAAAGATERAQLFSAIAVAFSRNPMTVAVAANDVQELSGGRLLLGLGSQVQAHVERRFSMPWSKPAVRMREFIQAVRAIWASFETGERLRFQGEFYTHTLMSPFFSPGPNPYGNPEVWLAAVGERMTETAGAVADGLVVHSFTTRRYLDEVTLPALDRGAAEAGRSRPQVSIPAFVVLGRDPAELMRHAAEVGRQIAFYASTPAYLPVMDLHGWADKAEALNAASRRGDWAAMGQLVDEEMLRAFAVVGDPAEVAAGLRARYGGIADRISFSTPYPVAPETWAELYAHLRA